MGSKELDRTEQLTHTHIHIGEDSVFLVVMCDAG